MHRKQFLHALAGLGIALTGAPAAFAQSDKPLEWVVGYAAGGGSDIVARTVAESMSQTLGRSIIINNKPGAGTNIAAEYTARSRDPASTMFTADFATLAANPWLFSKLSYNAEKDFQPVGLLVRFPMLLVVRAQHPAKNLKEFMAWAQSQKESVPWASAGPGSPHHLVGELFREQSGLKLSHIPYRGAAPAIQDVIGGQVAAMWVDSASALPFLNSGKMRAIGLASPQRMPILPDVPTLSEQGLKGFEGYAWQGLVAPTATPAETAVQWGRALQTALADTSTKARLQALGVETMPGTAADMARFAQSERTKWGRVITQAGVRLD